VKQECAMFTCHPIEKPYLIFQVGSADPDPELAVQAARVIMAIDVPTLVNFISVLLGGYSVIPFSKL